MSLASSTAGKQAVPSQQEQFLDSVARGHYRKMGQSAAVVGPTDTVAEVLERAVSAKIIALEDAGREIPAQFDVWLKLIDLADVRCLEPHGFRPWGRDGDKVTATPDWKLIDGAVVVQWECEVLPL